MLSSCLLSGLGIGVLSTGIYYLITDNKDEDPLKKKDKKMEYCTIFSIVLLVSVFVLYFPGDKNDKLVPMKSSITSQSPTMNNNPPF